MEGTAEEPESGYGGTAYQKGYGSIDYWDDRYGNWAQNPYDWIFEWRHVKPVVEKFVNRADAILIPGCGNAPFSAHMYEDGYQNQTNIDLSQVAIEKMNENHTDIITERESCCDPTKGGMTFVVMDALNTWWQDGIFDVVLDKSLIDTTVCMPKGRAKTRKFVKEMARVLKTGGIYCTMSLHTIQEIAHYFKHPVEKLGCKLAMAAVMLENDSDAAQEAANNDGEEEEEKEITYQTLVVARKLASSATAQEVAEETDKIWQAIKSFDLTSLYEAQKIRLEEQEKIMHQKRIAFCLRLITKGRSMNKEAVAKAQKSGKESDVAGIGFTEGDAKLYKDHLIEKCNPTRSDTDLLVCTSLVASMLCEKLEITPPKWAQQEE